ncbi:MAG: tRNA (pseudouridine(54)-N(1))-methyltransferase TrmY, partial [DPANN group archaeon]|nr:tRNA (pseudouridine(54)-N(1))-methyltransferase TrmY [DPANN group archaeon]
MRHIVYFSQKARTTGNFGDDLMKAGRMDIACQIVIIAFFISNHMRNNVKLHLIFNGPPDAQKHLELFPGIKLHPDDDENERD